MMPRCEQRTTCESTVRGQIGGCQGLGREEWRGIANGHSVSPGGIKMFWKQIEGWLPDITNVLMVTVMLFEFDRDFLKSRSEKGEIGGPALSASMHPAVSF